MAQRRLDKFKQFTIENAEIFQYLSRPASMYHRTLVIGRMSLHAGHLFAPLSPRPKALPVQRPRSGSYRALLHSARAQQEKSPSEPSEVRMKGTLTDCKSARPALLLPTTAQLIDNISAGGEIRFVTDSRLRAHTQLPVSQVACLDKQPVSANPIQAHFACPTKATLAYVPSKLLCSPGCVA